MLTDRPEFREWLARHDAQGFAIQKYGDPPKRHTKDDDPCDCCGGLLGDTPSQLGEYCLVCLAERFGGDMVEERITKTLLGGIVKAAMRSDEITDDLVVSTVADAIRETEAESAFAWGRGCSGKAA